MVRFILLVSLAILLCFSGVTVALIVNSNISNTQESDKANVSKVSGKKQDQTQVEKDKLAKSKVTTPSEQTKVSQRKVAPSSQDDFTPTEEISEDLAVSFPTDI